KSRGGGCAKSVTLPNGQSLQLGVTLERDQVNLLYTQLHSEAVPNPVEPGAFDVQLDDGFRIVYQSQLTTQDINEIRKQMSRDRRSAPSSSGCGGGNDGNNGNNGGGGNGGNGGGGAPASVTLPNGQKLQLGETLEKPQVDLLY